MKVIGCGGRDDAIFFFISRLFQAIYAARVSCGPSLLIGGVRCAATLIRAASTDHLIRCFRRSRPFHWLPPCFLLCRGRLLKTPPIYYFPVRTAYAIADLTKPAATVNLVRAKYRYTLVCLYPGVMNHVLLADLLARS